MTKNTVTVLGWAYEATNGTSAIDGAADVTYLFGRPTEDYLQIESGLTKNPSNAYNYASREVAQSAIASTSFPEFNYSFIPTNAIYNYHFGGSAASGTPNVTSILDSGLKKSITIHWENKGGTAVQRTNKIGAYAVERFEQIQMNLPMRVEMKYAFQQLEDQGDATCPVLTTAPIYPDSLSSGFSGMSEIKWGGVAIPWIYKVELTSRNNHSASYDDTTRKTREVYMEEIAPYEFTMFGVMEENSLWDALIDETSAVLDCKTHRNSNVAHYIQPVLTNCRILSATRTQTDLPGGMYEVALIGQAESRVTNFIDGTTFGTFYP